MIDFLKKLPTIVLKLLIIDMIKLILVLYMQLSIHHFLETFVIILIRNVFLNNLYMPRFINTNIFSIFFLLSNNHKSGLYQLLAIS